MSYDYSSSGSALELPNPYKVQNTLLFVSGGTLVLAGLLTLFLAKSTLALIPIAIGLALLGLGLVAFGMAAKRLRFFFGRGRPRSLAPELDQTVTGTSPDADALKRLLREGSLTYPEPQSAIDGVLYHWVPQLITSPMEVQKQARSAFFNLCALVAAAISFIVSWGLFGNEQNRPLLSIAYFVFGLIFLLRPILGVGKANLDMKTLILLIAAAILGPTLVGMVGKELPVANLSLAPQTFMLIISGNIAAALVLVSTLKQLAAPPATQTSVDQSRLSLNVPPSLLLDELERRMQEQWTERIPNRRYSRATPVIDPALHAGPFSGELLEESQPTPMSKMAPASLGQALSSDRHRFLALLDLFATMLVVIAVVCAVMFASKGVQGLELPLHLFGASSIFLVVAGFCFRSSSMLWGRFDFQSVLTWVEMEGTYQTATVGTGNQLTARVQTSNQIVRTEAMTLRVWRARIESVVFGKDAHRQITAMFSTDAETKELARHLEDFGHSRASLVAPDSQADIGRIASIALVERALGSPSDAAALQKLPAAEGLLIKAEGGSSSGEQPKYCRHCGAKNMADARFCESCGGQLGETLANR